MGNSEQRASGYKLTMGTVPLDSGGVLPFDASRPEAFVHYLQRVARKNLYDMREVIETRASPRAVLQAVALCDWLPVREGSARETTFEVPGWLLAALRQIVHDHALCPGPDGRRRGQASGQTLLDRRINRGLILYTVDVLLERGVERGGNPGVFAVAKRILGDVEKGGTGLLSISAEAIRKSYGEAVIERAADPFAFEQIPYLIPKRDCVQAFLRSSRAAEILAPTPRHRPTHKVYRKRRN
jgi:hypothetical protein